MNGPQLLNVFLEFIDKEKPERFGFGSFRDLHETCSIVVAREACYRAYDAVLFQKFGGLVREIIPVEVKGDTDVLDDGRLRSQIWTALKNFGNSLLLLDVEQAYKAKKLKLTKMLPCEIWGYNRVTFHQLSEPIFKHDYNDGKAKISQRAIEKAFGIHEPKTLREIRKRVTQLRSVLAALTENQWRFEKERRFTPEEAEVAYALLGYPLLPNVVIPKEKPDLSVRTIFSNKTIQKSLFER